MANAWAKADQGLTTLLSDRFRTVGLVLGWPLLLWMIVLCSRYSLDDFVPGIIEYLQEPRRYDGTEVRISFGTAVWLEDRSHLLLRTNIGFYPLVFDAGVPQPADLPESSTISLRGIWHKNGTISVQELWRHPLRTVKERVSTAMVPVLLLAFVWTYRPDQPLRRRLAAWRLARAAARAKHTADQDSKNERSADEPASNPSPPNEPPYPSA